MPPRLRVLSGGDVCRILASNGFVHVRTRGSHAMMRRLKPEGGSITVPVPLHEELAQGTLRGIIQQSGLDRVLFEAG